MGCLVPLITVQSLIFLFRQRQKYANNVKINTHAICKRVPCVCQRCPDDRPDCDKHGRNTWKYKTRCDSVDLFFLLDATPSSDFTLHFLHVTRKQIQSVLECCGDSKSVYIIPHNDGMLTYNYYTLSQRDKRTSYPAALLHVTFQQKQQFPHFYYPSKHKDAAGFHVHYIWKFPRFIVVCYIKLTGVVTSLL